MPTARLGMVPGIILAVTVLLLIGCGSARTDETPVSTQIATVASGSYASGHQLWGYWEGYIPETHDSLEFAPVRGLMIHLNARKFVEETPCDHCLTLVNLEIDAGAQTITAEIQLTHPYPGLAKFTGFDVRAVIISDGSLSFPYLNATVPDGYNGDFSLLHPDGYTRLWNTLEFPPGSGLFQILEYSRGRMASPGDFTGTVNPYCEYNESPRRHFPAGGSITNELVFRIPDGPIRFGYAIDASWEPPIVDPPIDIQTDFSLSANALEPVDIGWALSILPTDKVGSTGLGTAYLLDRQGWETISTAYLECPDLWTGVIEPNSITSEVSSSEGDLVELEFTLTNELGAPSARGLPALLKVVDVGQDPLLGDVNHAYQLVGIDVVEEPQPQFEGEMVFTAPGPPGPGGEPGALNVFLLDLGTMLETQLTPYIGLGAIFQEPRINPVGTHMLLSFGPTPYASHVEVYEIGGGSWGVSPAAVYDGTACFHPDGQHILVASGTQFDDTPNLYSMEYDGSNRTLIATAGDTVRNPCWSPDGKQIVMTQGLEFSDPPNSGLWIYDVDSGLFHEIMQAPGVDENPCWSPVKVDGVDLIVFASSRDHHPNYETDIYIVSPEIEEILYRFDMGLQEQHPSFSPDGLSFVFSAPTPDGEELFVFSWKTEELTQITDDDSWDGSPSWGWNW